MEQDQEFNLVVEKDRNNDEESCCAFNRDQPGDRGGNANGYIGTK